MYNTKKNIYDTRKDPCRKNACLIQTCLKGKYKYSFVYLKNHLSYFMYELFLQSTENKYQESACQEVLELMRECCRKYKDQSICCEGIDIRSSKALAESITTKKLVLY